MIKVEEEEEDELKSSTRRGWWSCMELTMMMEPFLVDTNTSTKK